MGACVLAVDDVVLLPQGALLVPEAGALVVADLHVGYEDAARAAGAGLPRGPSPAEAIEAAFRMVSDSSVTDRGQERIRKIIVNGDAKHAHAPLLAQARALRALHARLSALAPVVYVRGNHDAGLERILPDADVCEEARAGRYRIVHGHAGSARGARILGHEHPAVVLRDAVGARMKLRAFLRAGNAWVLPALSPWASGVDVLASGFSGPSLRARDPRDARAYVLADGDVLDFGPLAAAARAGVV